MSNLQVESFFDKATYTLSYVVYDSESKDAVIIDPVLDFDAASGKISKESIAKLDNFINENDLNPKLILETHAHADHISSAAELKRVYPSAKTGVAKSITKVQDTFSAIFNIGSEVKSDGSQFDLLLEDGQTIEAGTVEFKVIYTPGHTPACTSFLFEDKLFTGDSIFMPDFGTGRCDFPLGSANDLYDSITKKIYSLPPETKIYVGHDYQPNGRDLKFMTTVEEQKEKNIHLNSNTKKEDFVEMRTSRDKTLSAPKLLLPSIQININAGELPKPESNGKSYLKTPLTQSE